MGIILSNTPPSSLTGDQVNKGAIHRVFHKGEDGTYQGGALRIHNHSVSCLPKTRIPDEMEQDIHIHNCPDTACDPACDRIEDRNADIECLITGQLIEIDITGIEFSIAVVVDHPPPDLIRLIRLVL